MGEAFGFPDTDPEFDSGGSQSFLPSLFSLSHQLNFIPYIHLFITRPTKAISIKVASHLLFSQFFSRF